jgi:hypothetical protein
MTNDDIPLKEYFDMRFDMLAKQIDATANGLEKRLEGMNEFREQLNQQTRSFISRMELEAVSDRVNKNENRLSNIEGRIWAVGAIFAIISLGTSIALHFVH